MPRIVVTSPLGHLGALPVTSALGPVISALQFTYALGITMDSKETDSGIFLNESLCTAMSSEQNGSEKLQQASESDTNEQYFSSYKDLSVHELMLKDRPRTLAYKNFIFSNKHLFHDKIVLDVGAGTGILSLFSAAAGARKVYAVEASGISEACKQIVKYNKLDSQIIVIQDKVENIEIPEGKVDIIVSEWMGFYLFHESMLDSVIFARNKFLADDGLMLPAAASLYLCPVSMKQYVDEHFEFWKDVYGFDFSPLMSTAVNSALSQPTVTNVKNKQCLSDPGKIITIDLKEVSLDDVRNFSQKLSFYIEKSGSLHGFVSWFDVDFEGNIHSNSDKKNVVTVVKLSTSPFCEETHWKQTVFFLPASLTVDEGDIIHCRIELAQDENNKRHYNISVEMLPSIEDDEFESSEEDFEEDTSTHPVPCDCGSGRCDIIRAIMEKYDEEQTELENEAEAVELNAEKEAARVIDMEDV